MAEANVSVEFGEDLRSERERRGLSLDALCTETKVNSRHLDALERGDFKALPGGVFRRGIVRAYLAALALDETAWMARFDACFAEYTRLIGEKLDPDEEAWARFAYNVKRNRQSQRRSTTGRWLGVLAMLVALLAAVWAVWHFLLQAR